MIDLNTVMQVVGVLGPLYLAVLLGGVLGMIIGMFTK